MTVFRLISFSAHAAIELLGGMLLLAAPFALGFGSAGIVVCVFIGALMVGLALTATGDGHGGGLPVSAHAGLDRTLAASMLGAAIGLGAAGDPGASVCLLAVALAELALSVTTRYSFAG